MATRRRPECLPRPWSAVDEMHRPPAEPGGVARGVECGPDGVMKDEPSAGTALHVADFLDLERLDIPVRAEPGRYRRQRPPLVGRGKDQRCWEVGRIPAGGARICPCRHRRDFLLAQGDVVLVVLDADILLDEPGWHDSHSVAQTRTLFDTARPGPRVLVAEEHHRGDRVRSVTVLAATLKDRRDVPGERHLVVGGLASGRGSSGSQLVPAGILGLPGAHRRE